MTLARTDAKNVRKLAALLGIQYRALSNGEFNHTTALILIDAQGRITGRTAQLGSADAAFVKLVKSAASTGANWGYSGMDGPATDTDVCRLYS